MKLEELTGKSMFEVVQELGSFEWTLGDRKVHIKSLLFAEYDYRPNGLPEEKLANGYGELYYYVELFAVNWREAANLILRPNPLSGLMSKVEVEPGDIFPGYDMYTGSWYAHIPMIEFDTEETFSFMPERELLDMIKRNITLTTEISSGVLLQSGPHRNYFFMGLGRLLTEEEMITFIGRALCMQYRLPNGKDVPLADSVYLGHALTPMAYVADITRRQYPDLQPSAYNYPERFLTLRINPKPGYAEPPRVVDIMRD